MAVIKKDNGVCPPDSIRECANLNITPTPEMCLLCVAAAQAEAWELPSPDVSSKQQTGVKLS